MNINVDKIKDTKFWGLCKRNKFILISFFTAIAIMLLIFFCYDMVPFGDITILRMDLYHQYGPLFAELFDRITSGEGIIYSWQSGGGGSFLGNFFNYLSSPLSIIILLFGHINITDAIAALILLKSAFSAGTFTYYLKASDDFKKHSAITAGFGLLYAFSGYFVAYYWNLMWLDGMVLLPLVVLGIERIINGKKPWLYIVSLAVLMVSSYYMAYMVCIFSVLYALMYYFGKHGFTKKLLHSAGKFIASSIAAGGLAAFALLPVYHSLKSCSATSGSFPKELSTYFNVFDFLANHLAGLDPTIRSSGEDVLPNIFCGIGTVMLAFLYLYVKSVPLREKISKAAMLVVLYLSFNLNYLNYIWHGFHFPNDLPYRGSYLYSFILLLIAFKALLKIRELTGKELLNVGIGTAIFIVLVQEIGSKNVREETVVISIIFAVVYTVVFSLLNNKKFQASAVASLLFCCMFAEVAVADTNNFSMDQSKTNYTSDYNSFKVLKDNLDKYDGSDTYRMELTNLRTRMDPCWYGYNGISTFSSMAYEKSANLQYNLGMFGNYINSYTYNLQTPVYNAMFGLKYIVNNDENVEPSDHFYTPILKSGKFTAFSNDYSLPIAYCVNNEVANWKTISNNPFEIQSDYFAAATGINNVFSKIPITNVEYYNIQDFGTAADTGDYVYYKDKAGETASFTLTVTVQETQNIYLYLDSDNVDQLTVRNSDGSFVKNQDTSEEYILDLGVHEAGEELYIDVPISDGDSGYVEVYVEGLNEDLFKEGYSKLNDAGAMNVTSFKDTKIEGTVSADEDCILYTSINYDDSWKVYVDGKQLENDSIIKVGNALLGVKIKAGTHNVTFKYEAKGLDIGIIISVLTFAVILSLLFIQKRKAKVPAKEIPEKIEDAEETTEQKTDNEELN